MPSVKISQLPEIVATDGGELFLVVQGGISKNVPLNKLFDGLVSSKSFNFNIENTKEFIVSNDAATILYAQIDKVGVGTDNPLATLHVYGSTKIGEVPSSVSTINNHPAVKSGVVMTPYEVHFYNGATFNNGTINHAVDTTLLSITNDKTFTLGTGTEGQSKTVVLYSVTGGAKATINPTLKMGFQNVVLPSVGSNVTMKFIANSWVITSVFNASVNY